MQTMEQSTENGRSRDGARNGARDGEQGFMLLGLIVAIALILLVLSVAATEVAFSLRREREVESARRADQYVRAIRRFYLKTQHYPGSIEQLVKTNNIRYLRQQYVDPLTGKADYRLILVGKNKTTVKGFFGEPLTGLATAGLGSAVGTMSAGLGGGAASIGAGATIGVGASTAGATGAAGAIAAGAIGAAAIGAAAAASGVVGTTGVASPTDSSSTTTPLGSPGGFGSSPGTGLSGLAGPFMGVGSSAAGNSIIEPNEQTTYQTWEFLYDPRIELLKAKAALNSGLGSTGAGASGQMPSTSGFGSPAGTNAPTTGGTGATQPPKP